MEGTVTPVTTCTHSCPDHCPAPAGPDPDLALPPFPRRGGGRGRGVGAVTDRAFYQRFAAAYRLARTRHPNGPTLAVATANPGTSTDQVRRAVRRATDLGLLERVREPEPVPQVAPARRGRTTRPEPVPEPAPDPVLPDIAQILRENGEPATVEMVRWMGSGHSSEEQARTLMQQWVDAGLAGWHGDDAVTFAPVAG